MVEILDREVEAQMVKPDVLAYWKQGPLNRPLHIASATTRQVFWCQGPIISRKTVVGRPLPLVERLLGLRPGELGAGALVYELQRLPTLDEFDLSDSAPAFGIAARWLIRDDAFVPGRVVATVAPGRVIP